MNYKVRRGFILSDEFLIFLTILCSIAFRDIIAIALYIKLVFPLILIIKYAKRLVKGYRLKIYIPYAMFFCLCMLSTFWAIRPDYAFSECYVLARLYITVFGLGLAINSIKVIEKCLQMLHYAGVFLFVRLFINTPVSIWTDALFGNFDASSGLGRIGRTVGYHPNELGALCVILLLLSVYLYSKSGEHKVAWLLWDMILCFVLLFTKSRLSLLLALSGFALYLIMSQKRVYKQIVLIMLAVAFAVASWYAIFYIPVLYDLVGFRFAGVVGNAAMQDASTNTRLKFLHYAIELFISHPIVGIGIDNYKYYSFNFANAWAETYAHSNWGELLADTGLVGTVLYYFPFFIAILAIGKAMGKKRGGEKKMCAFFFSYLLITIVGDIQKMSYDRFDIFFLSMLAFFFAYYINKTQPLVSLDNPSQKGDNT